MDTTHRCSWVRERIDSWLDGAEGGLTAAEARLIESHAGGCPACAAEIELARRCRETLAGLPSFSPPAHVVNAAARAARGPRGNVVPMTVRRPSRVRTLLVVAASALVVVTGTALWRAQRATPVEETLTAADAEAAALEAALALAYVGKYTQRAESILVDDVIGLRIVHPVQRAFSTSRTSVDDAVVPGVRRALNASGIGATSNPSTRS